VPGQMGTATKTLAEGAKGKSPTDNGKGPQTTKKPRLEGRGQTDRGQSGGTRVWGWLGVHPGADNKDPCNCPRANKEKLRRGQKRGPSWAGWRVRVSQVK